MERSAHSPPEDRGGANKAIRLISQPSPAHRGSIEFHFEFIFTQSSATLKSKNCLKFEETKAKVQRFGKFCIARFERNGQRLSDGALMKKKTFLLKTR